MPLNMVTEGQSPGAARNIFGQAIALNARYIGDAGMGGYCTANNTAAATALTTSGAGPCQIIIVHKAPGIGALGHYAAHPNPRAILEGLVSMVVAVGGVPIDSIVFSAGAGVGETNLQQKAYEMLIFAGARRRYPHATVHYPLQNATDPWGAAVYLPLTGDVALFQDLPWNIIGLADVNNGLVSRAYRGFD